MKAFPESTTPFGVQAEQAAQDYAGDPVIRAYLGSGKQGSPSPDNTTVIPTRLVCVYRPWSTSADLHVGP